MLFHFDNKSVFITFLLFLILFCTRGIILILDVVPKNGGTSVTSKPTVTGVPRTPVVAKIHGFES
jgi:hypothetical protein